jgi:hypothetical protein
MKKRMTLDVTIGKIGFNVMNNRVYLTVHECPEADKDICDPGATIYPRKSYRSGSSGFWLFWEKNDLLHGIYKDMRDNPNSNDHDVALVEPFLKLILMIRADKWTEPFDRDRLKWLQYWAAKAVELYGKEAGIQFS